MSAAPFSVCVFTASTAAVPESWHAMTAELGREIARRGWRLVYGGGQVGLMGVVARAALEAGGAVTGIIPAKLNSREVAFDDIDDLVVVDTLLERKQVMDERSDAFVVLPGGIGTLDEMLDMWTTRHLGFHERPVILADPDGYWDPLFALLKHMVSAGTLRQETFDMLDHAGSVTEVMTILEADRA